MVVLVDLPGMVTLAELAAKYKSDDEDDDEEPDEPPPPRPSGVNRFLNSSFDLSLHIF